MVLIYIRVDVLFVCDFTFLFVIFFLSQSKNSEDST